MTISKPNDVPRPWYREPWPWILAAGPFVVVIAAFYTAWLAIKSDDGLVTDDYYKKGLAANQTIARSDEAAKLGLAAAVVVSSSDISIKLRAAVPTYEFPKAIALSVSHPTRAGLDQFRMLTRNGDRYQGDIRLPAAGHWLIMLEDEARTWRLLGNVVLPANGETVIGATAANGPRQAADIRN